MNPLAWILDSLKVHPEPASIPDVSDLAPVQLAEIRSRLQTFAQVATELRRQVDAELAGKIPTALRYGEDIYRPTNGKGSAKIIDPEMWWHYVSVGLGNLDEDARAGLLGALYPASAVRLTALKLLAAAVGIEEGAIKDTFIAYDPPTSSLSVMPRSKAPKFLQDLEEGEVI